MTIPNSIGEFLESSGAHYRLFDLGCQLRNLPKQSWQQFDQGGPYPFTHLSHAWLVILLWHPDNPAQHSIWFMKLPLDEQGGLPVAVHQDVLSRLIKALATPDAAERQRLLTDHPYQFRPDLHKMAALNARARRILGAEKSSYFQAAWQRLIENDEHINWQTLGLQGLAEVLECLKPRDQIRLASHLPGFPHPLQTNVMALMEHHRPDLPLTQSLLQIARVSADDQLVVAAIRAVSQAQARGLVQEVIAHVLNRCPDDLELTLSCLSRHPDLLKDTDLALVLLDRLAHQADQDGFNRVVQGLAMQPGLSGLVMAALRHPSRTDRLAQAIGGLIQEARSTQ